MAKKSKINMDFDVVIGNLLRSTRESHNFSREKLLVKDIFSKAPIVFTSYLYFITGYLSLFDILYSFPITSVYGYINIHDTRVTCYPCIV